MSSFRRIISKHEPVITFILDIILLVVLFVIAYRQSQALALEGQERAVSAWLWGEGELCTGTGDLKACVLLGGEENVSF
ncbi:hypothetical protein L873DRAFT_1800529 [Choiromyces venosus 120613-1]|uniref:Uncharacterized protein n=1 Tax=Choiromyces venosus 120613-1 TaxID=1336337 RepID=A0A3N4K2M2_9PEZI|nr:hypothetical protein L873DRAFT_1800529 [Choiromyces venosus 120613-1]